MRRFFVTDPDGLILNVMSHTDGPSPPHRPRGVTSTLKRAVPEVLALLSDRSYPIVDRAAPKLDGFEPAQRFKLRWAPSLRLGRGQSCSATATTGVPPAMASRGVATGRRRRDRRERSSRRYRSDVRCRRGRPIRSRAHGGCQRWHGGPDRWQGRYRRDDGVRHHSYVDGRCSLHRGGTGGSDVRQRGNRHGSVRVVRLRRSRHHPARWQDPRRRVRTTSEPDERSGDRSLEHQRNPRPHLRCGRQGHHRFRRPRNLFDRGVDRDPVERSDRDRRFDRAPGRFRCGVVRADTSGPANSTRRSRSTDGRPSPALRSRVASRNQPTCPLSAIAIDRAGNIVFAGNAGCFMTESSKTTYMMVGQMSPTGTLISVGVYTFGTDFTTAEAIAVTPSGAIIVGGRDIDGFWDVLKLNDPSGTKLPGPLSRSERLLQRGGSGEGHERREDRRRWCGKGWWGIGSGHAALANGRTRHHVRCGRHRHYEYRRRPSVRWSSSAAGTPLRRTPRQGSR